MKSQSNRSAMIIGVCMIVSASLIAGGVARAAGTTIYACAKKKTGAMRLVKTPKCKKSEKLVSWGATGPKGASGKSAFVAFGEINYIAGSVSLNSSKTTSNVNLTTRYAEGEYGVQVNSSIDLSKCVIMSNATDDAITPARSTNVVYIDSNTFEIFSISLASSVTTDGDVEFQISCT